MLTFTYDSLDRMHLDTDGVQHIKSNETLN